VPNKVIVQIHRLAISAVKYEGILFTDTHGNILTNQIMGEEDKESMQWKTREEVHPM